MLWYYEWWNLLCSTLSRLYLLSSILFFLVDYLQKAHKSGTSNSKITSNGLHQIKDKTVKRLKSCSFSTICMFGAWHELSRIFLWNYRIQNTAVRFWNLDELNETIILEFISSLPSSSDERKHLRRRCPCGHVCVMTGERGGMKVLAYKWNIYTYTHLLVSIKYQTIQIYFF